MPGSRAPSATRTIQGEGAGTDGAAGDTFDTSRADNLAQLFRDALAELDALEEDGEEGLDASAPPVAENATESHMVSAQPVQRPRHHPRRPKPTRRSGGAIAGGAASG